MHMLSLMERVLCHFLWDVGPMNVNINTLKVGFFCLQHLSQVKKVGCMINKKTILESKTKVKICLAVLFSENR